ncbi:MAG: ABC transporter substrate-binding protein [Acidobacteria bacterium]|nr:ABC transporter substrate-binding protein [Acidobacteriota bacterium]MBI3657164.1 ABC transporter substrate-binding protein [Acidobacteriota bacterium]
MRPRSRSTVPFSILFFSILIFILAGCSNKPSAADKVPIFAKLAKDACVVDCGAGRYGGRLVYAAPAEPKSFNRLLVKDQGSFDIAERIHAGLIQLNHSTQKLEPGLAKSWQFSQDHRILDLALREEVRFSDGHPFTADDVVFTFTVLLDPKLNLPLRTAFVRDKELLRVEKTGTYAVRLIYPKPTVTAEFDLKDVALLPRHKLEAAYQSGQMESAWTGGAAPEEIVGLGPFKVKDYIPGQRLTLARNVHYWKVDRAGARLPYLDSLVIIFIPDRNARLLRFESGEVDIHDDLRPEDFSTLQRADRQRDLVLYDIGPAISSEFFWFNQNPELNPKSKQPYLAPHKFKWFSDVRFRRAISHALDRGTMSQVGFLGKASPAYGPFNASNKVWSDPTIARYEYNPGQALALLQEAGFKLNAGSSLVDRQGHPVAFSMITNADNTLRQKMGSLLQQDLAKVGISVRLAPLEFGAVIQAITGGDYEACLFGFRNDNPDPSAQQGVWLSNNSMHAWYPNQKTPATAWERRLDQLMTEQMFAFDFKERKRLVDDAQKIIAENIPIIYLVSKDILVGAKRKIGNFKPSILDHRTLWNCEELYWQAGS